VEFAPRRNGHNLDAAGSLLRPEGALSPRRFRPRPAAVPLVSTG
jgi:hypothetical protein